MYTQLTHTVQSEISEWPFIERRVYTMEAPNSAMQGTLNNSASFSNILERNNTYFTYKKSSFFISFSIILYRVYIL